MNRKKAFGDFQTPPELARQVVERVAKIYTPALVIEPTAGLGQFLTVAQQQWGDRCQYVGYEINPDYVQIVNTQRISPQIHAHQQNFFTANWRQILQDAERPTLLLGNPPWVTNSELSILESDNLPQKRNFQHLIGLEALMGKSNFDIAEWMLIHLLDVLPETGMMAMLCKTATARKVMRHRWKRSGGCAIANVFIIDAKSHFNAAVDACLLVVSGRSSAICQANVYSSLAAPQPCQQFGWVQGNLVADMNRYRQWQAFDGKCQYVWRSGVKHDASEILELTWQDGSLMNGLGEVVDVEPNYIYPLLKSSDLGNARNHPRKAILIPQKHPGDDTQSLEAVAPKTWQYLQKHADRLDTRKSAIYRKRPRFSIFGIGDYSFSLWKVAISGLYKSYHFVIVPPSGGKPVMLDDTCYSIACQSEAEAVLLSKLLNMTATQEFLRALTFEDNKRPITADVLRRINLVNIAAYADQTEQLLAFLADATSARNGEQQLLLI